MDISSVSTRTSSPYAAQLASMSGREKINDDKKSVTSDQIYPFEMDKLSKELNTYMDDRQTSLGFVLYEGLDHQVVVEIKNRETGELIRQIPSEDMLKIREKIAQSTGLLFDRTI